MARKILVTFFLGFVCILMIGSYVSNADARTQKMLKTRTQLRPVAWPESKTKPWFAPGPYWVDEWEEGYRAAPSMRKTKPSKSMAVTAGPLVLVKALLDLREKEG